MKQLFDHEEAVGTSLQGYMEANFSDLVRVFGAPSKWGSGDGKIQAEWIYKTPYGVATIYDYKEYDNYLDNVTLWHLGGKDTQATEYLKDHYQTEIKTLA